MTLWDILRNAYLFFVSLFFYYKASGVFLLLLLFVVTYNYFAARALRRARPAWQTFWVALSVVVDLTGSGSRRFRCP